MSQQAPARRAPSDGVLVGRPFGVPVYVSWGWFLASAVLAIAFAPVVAQRIPGLTGFWTYAVAATFAVLLGLSVLVHELAHSVVGRAFGLPVRRITLHLLGGVSELGSDARTPGRDLLVAAAGPLASLAIGALALLSLRVLTPGTVLHLVAFQLAFANLLVGVFNLLPGLPLDGGRIVRAVVWRVTGRPDSATVVAAWAGRGVAVLVVGLALLPLALGSSDPVWLLWGVILAGFIWGGATQTLTAVRVQQRLPGLSAGRLARRATVVPADLPVSEALRRLAAERAGGIVVVDGLGRAYAVVNEAAVAAIPLERRPWMAVATASRTLQPGTTVPIGLAGEPLLRHLAEHQAQEYLVVDTSDRPYGVLARADVERALTDLTRH